MIDPAAFGDIADFKVSTTKLAEDILAVEPIDPSQPVRVPGYRGAKRREGFIAAGTIEIEDDEWKRFEAALTEMGKE